jgi:hypothetical protein
MNQKDTERIYFNQNLIYHKDKIYNSNGSLEISICSSTTDYKTFSPPTLHIAVIGENNFRRICSLNYSDATDLFISIKDNILPEVNNIYLTSRNNVLLKKYQFDRSLKFEFINIQSMNERVVAISVIHSSSDFTKVVVPYVVFLSFSVGILKYFINDYVKISFDFSSRSLLTELLEQSKMIKNGIQVLPSNLIENKNITKEEFEDKILSEEAKSFSSKTEMTIDDFNKFLGKDMENINIPDLEKIPLEEKISKKLEVNSLLITNTLSNDLFILESMLSSSITRKDSMNSIFEAFRRSMNLNNSFNFLPGISEQDYKSLLYISKYTHDLYLSFYLNKNIAIRSSFPILKYQPDLNQIDVFHLNLCYDLLLIFGFIKIFRSKMESRESDASKNGALFYLRLREFLDPLVYSFLDPSKAKMIFNIICTNFDKYSELGFFKHYQNILKENKFTEITSKDIYDFCNELSTKVFSNNNLSKNINMKHDELFKTGFLKIKSDNNLSLEQIINELIPLEILEKNGIDLREGTDSLNNILSNLPVSKEVLDLFHKKEVKVEPNEKKKETNILKTVKFFDNEVPNKYQKDFFEYIDSLKNNNYDFDNGKFELEEFGENIIKTIYVWNSSDKKDEPLSTFRVKLEECILEKELIITSIMTKPSEDTNAKQTDEWNLEFE